MRRLLQHAVVGVGFTALTVSAGIAGLGSPAGNDVATAVPAPAVSISAPASATPETLNAERVAREAEQNRSAAREQLSAAVSQASQRSTALVQQSRSISQQQAKIKVEQQERAAAKKRAAAAAAKAKARAAADARAKAAERAAAEKAAAKRAVSRQGYTAGTTDPREIAKQILENKFNYGSDEYSCFNNIIIRESNWDIDATNPSSGAYGIPQALPGSKMASVASDWRTNPATQIIWAVGYMKDRYGSPCEAWSFKRGHGWY